MFNLLLQVLWLLRHIRWGHLHVDESAGLVLQPMNNLLTQLCTTVLNHTHLKL